MALVQSISISFNQVEVIGFATLILKCFCGVLSEAEPWVVEKLWNSLENDGRLHPCVGIIDTNQVTDAHIVSKHNVASTVIAVGDLQEALLIALSSRAGKVFSAKVETQMSVQVGRFLELSTTVNSGSGNPTDLEVVVEEHAMEDFIDVFASQSLQVTTGHTGNALEDLTEANYFAFCFHCVFDI